MIKKSVHENEIIAVMERLLVKQAAQRDYDNLEKAAEYLNSAAEIFEDCGFTKNADEVLSILYKISQKSTTGKTVNDPHVKGLTPEKMVANLKHHGTEFNMSDDLNFEISDSLEVSDGEVSEMNDFEDEED